MPKNLSTKPYLVRAMYEWCTDSGYTPYMAVKVTGQPNVVVPREFVDKDGEIVLNISFDATRGLKIDNEAVTFKARFAGVERDIYVPVGAISALYSGETNQGMAFEVITEIVDETELPQAAKSEKPTVSLAVTNKDSPGALDGKKPDTKRKKPGLTVIK